MLYLIVLDRSQPTAEIPPAQFLNPCGHNKNRWRDHRTNPEFLPNCARWLLVAPVPALAPTRQYLAGAQILDKELDPFAPDNGLHNRVIDGGMYAALKSSTILRFVPHSNIPRSEYWHRVIGSRLARWEAECVRGHPQATVPKTSE